MPEPQPVDLLVIGGGTAGLVASRTAASLGASVVLVERDRLGGDCLWTGCVPSKALLAAAARTAADGGGPVPAEAFAAAMRSARDAQAAIAPVDSAEALARDGVDVRFGDARFTGPGTAAVATTAGEQRIAFRRAVVATGSRARIPAVPGLDDVPLLTSDTVWSLTERPARLLVIGGGPQACEFGQAFARLGVAVTVVQQHGRLLPREVPEASALVEAALRADGADLRLGRAVVAVEPRDAGGMARLDDGAEVAFDAVLAAVGREARVQGLGLDAVGVALTDGGRVGVRRTLQTSASGVWAAGDVTPLPQYTHTAGMNGSTAATNAVLGLGRRVDERAIPHVVFTSPEVATVGPAGRGPEGTAVTTVPFDEVDRAIAERETAGFTRVETDGRGRVVAATVVGPRAGETIGEAALAIRNRLRVSDVAQTVHPYPTWNDGFWNACIAVTRQRLSVGAPAAAVRLLAAVRRRTP